MLVVGLTGGIGTGKTTVANLFAERGVPVIDADIIARDLTQPDSPIFLDIINHFEEPLLQENGALDRTMLRHIIFEQPEQRDWLEKLLHPLILTEMQNQIKSLTNPYCVAVIPLLLETGPYPFIDRILVVDTPEHLQKIRTQQRDNTHPDHIEAIIKSQTARDSRLSKAHDLITNDGIPEHLIPQVDKLHQQYLTLARGGVR